MLALLLVHAALASFWLVSVFGEANLLMWLIFTPTCYVPAYILFCVLSYRPSRNQAVAWSLAGFGLGGAAYLAAILILLVPALVLSALETTFGAWPRVFGWMSLALLSLPPIPVGLILALSQERIGGSATHRLGNGWLILHLCGAVTAAALLLYFNKLIGKLPPTGQLLAFIAVALPHMAAAALCRYLELRQAGDGNRPGNPPA